MSLSTCSCSSRIRLPSRFTSAARMVVAVGSVSVMGLLLPLVDRPRLSRPDGTANGPAASRGVSEPGKRKAEGFRTAESGLGSLPGPAAGPACRGSGRRMRHGGWGGPYDETTVTARPAKSGPAAGWPEPDRGKWEEAEDGRPSPAFAIRGSE